MNTSFNGGLVNDDKRAIIWIPDGLIKLRPKTFEIKDLDYLINSSHLFARKFDDNVDNDIIDQLLQYINIPYDELESDRLLKSTI